MKIRHLSRRAHRAALAGAAIALCATSVYLAVSWVGPLLEAGFVIGFLCRALTWALYTAISLDWIDRFNIWLWRLR